jgi:hypothetical protein
MMRSKEKTTTPAPAERGLTFRSVVLGLGIVVFINLWVTYAETVVHSSRLNLSYFQLTLMAVFLILVAVANPFLKMCSPRIAFSPSELLAIVAIGMVGCVVPASGITGFLIGVIATPIYFSTPENRWAEFYHPHLNSWVVPTEPEALRTFFEGLPLGASIPWGVWVAPLAWWATFILAVFALSASTMVILRKQWSDNEKLVYPLVAVPLEMARDAGAKKLIPEFMRGKLFWIPAIIAFALFFWNTVSWSFPLVPALNIFPNAGDFRFTRYSPVVVMEPLNLFTIGFAYFANTQVLFSVWFFFLLHVVEGGIFNRLGYQIERSTDTFSADPPTEAWQCFGAMACLVGWRLWVARAHLRDVFLKAIRPDHPVDDGREVLSYRTSVLGLLLSAIYALFWLQRSGMDVISASMFLFALGVIYIGLARVVSEAGVAYAQGTVTPQAFVMDLRGTYGLSGACLTSIALSYALIDYMRGLFTPGLAQAVRLGDRIRGNRRLLLFCVTVGVFAGLVTSVWFTLHLGHTHGAYNFSRLFFNGNPKAVFSTTLGQMRTPGAPELSRVLFFGIGAGLMGALTFLRYRFSWWPIHPIGLAVAAADNVYSLAMPVFMAWAAKAVVMRVGGVALYRRSKPLFLGLLVGYTAGVVLAFAVDAVWFPGQGHQVHWW